MRTTGVNFHEDWVKGALYTIFATDMLQEKPSGTVGEHPNWSAQ